MSGEQDQSGDAESPKVFLSYSRPEQPFALKVIAALEEAGIQVWWDGLLEAGTTFVKSTGQALEEADAIVVLWSELSVESHWVRDEATVGRDRRTLVPVSIDGVLPPLGFGQFHAISLQNWKGAGDAPEFANIVQSIWKLATGEVQADAAPPKPLAAAKVSRRGVMLTGGAGIVAAGAGLLAWQGGLFGGESNDAIQSVAVLPFDNLSGDASQDYFSDGVSEELRAVLAQNPQLRVVAQTSSNFFRDRDEDARTIARELQAGFLIDGSVRRSGDIVRIAVQLIDGANGFDRWSQSFETMRSCAVAERAMRRPMTPICAVWRSMISRPERNLTAGRWRSLNPRSKSTHPMRRPMLSVPGH
jgi:TolB-like protein